MKAQKIKHDPQNNGITALVHPVVVKLLEELKDVLFVTILGSVSNSCRSNHVLIFKVTDDSIVCVYESTYHILKHRGWGYSGPQEIETYKDTIGEKGTNTKEFDTPADIAFDKKENMYVADYGNHRIQKFDSNGNFISSFGEFGTARGELNNPADILITNSQLYVVDWNNNRIQVFEIK